MADRIDFLGTLEGRAGSRTHMHVVGASDSGKSKFLEMLMRDATLTRRGFCFIDYHGTTYNDIVRFLGTIRTNREVILINPSNPRYISGFNPFSDAGEDISTTVERRIALTIRPWGAKSTDATPTLERICRVLYHFAIATGETLPNAALLLDFQNRDVFNYALSQLDKPEHDIAHRKLAELADAKNAKEWRGETGSTDNRLTRFVGSNSVRRFTGLPDGNLNIAHLMERNAIILVNLASSPHLSADAARVFAALLINEFYDAALRRLGSKKHYFLVLDEFQEYITYDLAAMLDQVRKAGLHLVMAHQRFGQLNRDPELLEAMTTNARLKVLFGGLTHDTAVKVANEHFLSEINQRQIKATYYSRIIKDYEKVHLHSEGGSDTSGKGDSEGETRAIGSTARMVPDVYQQAAHSHHTNQNQSHADTYGDSEAFLPIFEDRVSNEAEWSREEKVSKVAERLKNLPQRHCIVVVGADTPVEYVVPFLQDYPAPKSAVEKWEEIVYKRSGAITAEEADSRLAKSRADFLEKVKRKPKPPREPKPPKAAKKSDPEPPPPAPPITGPPRI